MYILKSYSKTGRQYIYLDMYPQSFNHSIITNDNRVAHII